ncbi:MAG: Fur family transcriptional regulator [Anaerolineae bacterium]
MEPSGHLAEALKRAGYKLTVPRKAIVQVLEQEGEHLSSGEVLALGRRIYPLLSRATVYRTLEVLTNLGLIRPILLKEKDTAQRYVTGEGGHHHLVCSTCGAVFEFERCGVDQLAADLAQRFDFQIRSHLLEFYGICHACRMHA